MSLQHVKEDLLMSRVLKVDDTVTEEDDDGCCTVDDEEMEGMIRGEMDDIVCCIGMSVEIKLESSVRGCFSDSISVEHVDNGLFLELSSGESPNTRTLIAPELLFIPRTEPVPS